MEQSTKITLGLVVVAILSIIAIGILIIPPGESDEERWCWGSPTFDTTYRAWDEETATWRERYDISNSSLFFFNFTTTGNVFRLFTYAKAVEGAEDPFLIIIVADNLTRAPFDIFTLRDFRHNPIIDPSGTGFGSWAFTMNEYAEVSGEYSVAIIHHDVARIQLFFVEKIPLGDCEFET